jgi:radical SAM superfamily enzyme YgiQ (UPF0313 family)
MARVAFIQTEWFEHLGILYLAASLRAGGHKPCLIIERSPKKAAALIFEKNPDIAAFSATTGAHKAALAVAKELRPFFKGMIIMGGPHPTFFPEVINDPSLDAICRGEGDEALVEFCTLIERGEDPSNVQGFWIKKEGTIIKNQPAAPVPDLDKLPLPARDLLDYADPSFKKTSMRRIMIGRGCPYSCSYCFNDAMKQMIKGQGPYVRTRSIENVIAEIKTIAAHVDGPSNLTINFTDDSFGLRKSWALEFLDLYKTQIKLPFIVNLRAEQADQELVDALARAGCYCAQLGFESADQQARQSLLGRDMDDEELLDAAVRIKRAGIKLLTYNMVGLPGEKYEDAKKTLDWNTVVGTDFPRVSIFQPYPRTKLGDKVLADLKCSDQSSPDMVGESYFRSSPLKGPDARRIENLQKLFHIFIKYPALRGIVDVLTKMPKNPLLDFIFLASMGAQYQKATNRGLLETFTLGLRNIRAYFS